MVTRGCFGIFFKILNGIHGSEVLQNSCQVLVENFDAQGIQFIVAVEKYHIYVERILEDELKAIPLETIRVDLGIHHLGYHVQLDHKLA